MPAHFPSSKPVIITPASRFFNKEQFNHRVREKYLDALADLVGAVPIILPAYGEWMELEALISIADGVFLSGDESNVHPSRYGEDLRDDSMLTDQRRDETAFRLIRLCCEKNIPLLAVCRGLQEMNAALGGALHQDLRFVENLDDHGPPPLPDMNARYKPRHNIRVEAGGILEQITPAGTLVPVNSLHYQGIKELSSQMKLEAISEKDGLIEAASIIGLDFALGVQWHPEHYHMKEFSFQTKIFKSFARAAIARKQKTF